MLSPTSPYELELFSSSRFSAPYRSLPCEPHHRVEKKRCKLVIDASASAFDGEPFVISYVRQDIIVCYIDFIEKTLLLCTLVSFYLSLTS
jgi:hypothetical protein